MDRETLAYNLKDRELSPELQMGFLMVQNLIERKNLPRRQVVWGGSSSHHRSANRQQEVPELQNETVNVVGSKTKGPDSIKYIATF